MFPNRLNIIVFVLSFLIIVSIIAGAFYAAHQKQFWLKIHPVHSMTNTYVLIKTNTHD